MRPFRLLALAVPVIAVAAEPPPHKLIEESYFLCPASRTMQGGIFGKGPLRKHGPQPGQCKKAEWRSITRAEFKTLATQWYGVDWSRDIEFFREDRGVER